MLSALLFGLISLIWLAMGLAMIAVPLWWSAWVKRSVADALHRYVAAQGLILGGLILVLGASTHRGYWLWVTVGSLGVAIGMVLLGLGESRRERLLAVWERTPAWACRLAGVMTVTLATLLTIDTMRG
ncbi:MAG: hypothetical protein AAB093_07330 [Nitrospirota bacterium]